MQGSRYEISMPGTEEGTYAVPIGFDARTNLVSGERCHDGPPLYMEERLTAQIADAFMEHLNPQGVMVMIEAEHLCMTMRGIKKPGAQTVTVTTRGVFENNEKLQNTFYRMIGR